MALRIAIRKKLGLSKPRNSGFNRGGSNLENRDLSENRELVVDDDGEDQAGYSASNSLLFGLKREGSAWMRGVAEFSVG